MAESRISQIAPEVLAGGSPNARISQAAVEVEAGGTPNARLTQIAVEVLVPNGTIIPSNARISQAVVETSVLGYALARLAQIVLECLVPNIVVTMPPVFPFLPGLGYSVLWEPQFYNMPTAKAASGAELDLGLAAAPLHMFTLTYNFLREKPGYAEFKTLMGFFLAAGGNLGRFLFKNPDDYQVQQQHIGKTDGILHTWQIVRTFGDGANAGTEPVGYVDLTQPLNVYLDGVLQPADSYSIATTQPVNQLLVFNGTPANNQVITADFNYFYYCKFSDTSLSFEQFMHQLWSLKKLVLQSCRAGT